MVQLKECMSPNIKDAYTNNKKLIQIKKWNMEQESKIKTRVWYKYTKEWIKRKDDKKQDKDIKFNRKIKNTRNTYNLSFTE